MQAAIWYFSDNYVLDAERPAARRGGRHRENAVRTQPPLVQPPPPSLTITPTTVAGSTGTPTGPFTVTVTAPAPPPSSRSTRARCSPMPPARRRSPTAPRCHPGRTSGSQDAAAGTVTLSASAQADRAHGKRVPLRPQPAGLLAAQKLILAQTGVVRTDVQAQATLALPGSLTVTKTIGGAAAGQQGEIRIDVSCNGVGLDPFIIPAGTTGTPIQTYDGLLAGRRARSPRPPTGRPRP